MRINPVQPNNITFKNGFNIQNNKVDTEKSFFEENKKVITYAAMGIVLSTIAILAGKKIYKHISSQRIEKNYKTNMKKTLSIVNDIDSEKGLNKIKDHNKLVSAIKEDVISPYIMERQGYEIARDKCLPNGLTIETKGIKMGEKIIDAMMEHLKLLGYKTVKVDYSKAKTPDDFGSVISKTIKEAEELFADKKEYSFLNIGDLEKFALDRDTNHNFIKSVGLLLKKCEKSSQRGFFWTGWSSDFSKIDKGILVRGRTLTLDGKSANI